MNDETVRVLEATPEEIRKLNQLSDPTIRRIISAFLVEFFKGEKPTQAEMEGKVFPLTKYFDKTTGFGKVFIKDMNGLEVDTNYHFEPGFIKKEDGSLELTEFSMVLNKPEILTNEKSKKKGAKTK